MKLHLAIFLLLLFALSVWAQNREVAPTPNPTVSPTPATEDVISEDDEVLRIDTEEVTLNVRVVDSQNRPVGNLGKAEFKVYENDELQTITSFATTEIPTNYALMIDNSRSMRRQLEKVIEAGKIIVDMNRPRDKTTIVRFVSADKIEVVRDFTTDKRLLKNSLENLFTEGGSTAIIDAIYQTAKQVDEFEKSGKKNEFARRALIIVSDGEDHASLHKEQELIELLRRSEVQIYAIGFINTLTNEHDLEERRSRQENAKDFLTRLARETGGKVYFPNSLEELPQIAKDISAELRMQYLITYAPTSESNSKGSFKNIKVTINNGTNNEKRSAITRTGRAVSGNQ